MNHIVIEAARDFFNSLLERDLDSLADGALGFSIEDGKAIMALLQKTIVKQQCETYVLAQGAH